MCKIDNENDKNHWDRLIFALELAVNSTINMELTTYDCKYLLDKLTSLTDRITDLEAERRWIPVGSGEVKSGVPYLARTHNGIDYWVPEPPPPEDK